MMTARPKGQYIPAVTGVRGYAPVASPASGPLAYLEFGLIVLQREDPPLLLEAGTREVVLYLLGGSCRVRVTGPAGALDAVLNSRGSIFDGPPSAVFAPSGSILAVAPESDVRLAFFASPPCAERPPRMIGASEAEARMVGASNWTRKVYSVVDEHISSRLLIGETINPPGHWSSYPPHKHDATVPDRELPMEEIYHYGVRPPEGFGLQMVYTAADDPEPFNEIYRVAASDTVVIPRGYHPVVAAGGYQLAYVWAISGEQVAYRAWSEDPKYAWLKG